MSKVLVFSFTFNANELNPYIYAQLGLVNMIIISTSLDTLYILLEEIIQYLAGPLLFGFLSFSCTHA